MRVWTAATPSADCLFRVAAKPIWEDLGTLESNGQGGQRTLRRLLHPHLTRGG